MSFEPSFLAIWLIALLAIGGVLVRPFKSAEAIWAGAGAALLVGLGLLPLASALGAVAKGVDVYLFLTGMMLLSELARREGVFDVVAATVVNRAGGSTAKLFLLVYGLGVLVTIFLSNDATAVVLTPAVFAAARKARADPLPLLFVCALVANAASFVLPISNPANLVLYGAHTPRLSDWMRSFALPSALSILATYAALRWSQRGRLSAPCALNVSQPRLTGGGWTTLAAIGLTGVVLLVVSALNAPLGLPTCLLGVAAALAVLLQDRTSPIPLLKGVAWSVLPLVAGLFVLVEGLARTGLVSRLSQGLNEASNAAPSVTAAGAGALLALLGNLINNLPAGLIAGSTLQVAHVSRATVDCMLIGVDLGPNLSVTGSLATILWLTAIRREGENVGFKQFLKIGAVVMPPALVVAIGARLIG